MSRQLASRLKKLERQRRPGTPHVRLVWLEPGEPLPNAAPGERLVLVSWEGEPAAANLGADGH